MAACTGGVSGDDNAIIKENGIINKGSVGSVEYKPKPADGWALVWSDEFEGAGIDPDKWGYDIDCWGGGNDERQCYTDSPANASIHDGKLVITARREESTGPAFPPHMRSSEQRQNAEATKPYSSARMVTKGKAAWKYGWIEVRAKLPQGQGTWPAIWMLPEENAYGTWAASGEIDILEAVNLGVPCAECAGGKENTILGTLHFGGLWPDNKFASTEIAQPGSLDDFHTYAVVWSEGKFTWLVDGKIYAERSAEEWSSSGSSGVNAPFDKPFHLILNFAVGGKLPEERGLGGVSPAGFPKEMEIDWVRVWQCEADTATGKACPVEGAK
ncbi:glycoside hydrolase family 16 protein [Pontixanthobacter aquaemixtae]|uniref:glycoside hydrolase family 16 protein n=1 Tax=Pontixanthobacter aquaemixtae TaxID=1958940 RepID=UPI001F35BFA0|nr:glycoside hydrolase family 16 protein [Pontixanthobacter aquaemixtae]